MNIAQPDAPRESRGEPNFEILNRNVITEENWPEYQARGFIFRSNQLNSNDLSQRSELAATEHVWGKDRVFTGHAYDETEQRPLANKPGIGIYLAPQADDKHQPSDDGPASS